MKFILDLHITWDNVIIFLILILLSSNVSFNVFIS